MLTELDNTGISRHLGQKSERIETYTPTLLVRDLRSNSRDQLNIVTGEEPFIGYDLWVGYEVSCLLDDGSPITAVVKIVYDCNNPYIVESKSMKLYWNSFYMQKMGRTYADAIHHLEWTATKDLSELLCTKVQVVCFSADDNAVQNYEQIFKNYVNIDHIPAACDEYKENADLLAWTSLWGEANFTSTLLKSNCRETKQPDNGSIYIHIKGASTPTSTSVKRYIVSFRDENHFHEAIVDTIYSRLNASHPTELMVAATYVRRGGFSIAPIRANLHKLIPSQFIALDKRHYKTSRE